MSRSLARFISRAAAVYVPSHKVRLIARQDRFSRGSDHTAFTQYGFPAVAFRESKEDFSRQHAATDTVEGVDVRYLAQNARVNLAGVASLALAPPAPIVTNPRGQMMIGRQPAKPHWVHCVCGSSASMAAGSSSDIRVVVGRHGARRRRGATGIR